MNRGVQIKIHVIETQEHVEQEGARDGQESCEFVNLNLATVLKTHFFHGHPRGDLQLVWVRFVVLV